MRTRTMRTRREIEDEVRHEHTILMEVLLDIRDILSPNNTSENISKNACPECLSRGAVECTCPKSYPQKGVVGSNEL